jgi:hypothetical protein
MALHVKERGKPYLGRFKQKTIHSMMDGLEGEVGFY